MLFVDTFLLISFNTTVTVQVCHDCLHLPPLLACRNPLLPCPYPTRCRLSVGLSGILPIDRCPIPCFCCQVPHTLADIGEHVIELLSTSVDGLPCPSPANSTLVYFSVRNCSHDSPELEHPSVRAANVRAKHSWMQCGGVDGIDFPVLRTGRSMSAQIPAIIFGFSALSWCQ